MTNELAVIGIGDGRLKVLLADWVFFHVRGGGLQIPAVLAACDFTPARTIVDVGGGQGALLAALHARGGILRDRVRKDRDDA